MRHRRPSVTAVVPTLDPDPGRLSWTLERLASQEHPIKEAILVDSTRPTIHADVDGLPVRTIRFRGGPEEARAKGVEEARTPYIVELNEDSVFLNDDYVSEAVARVETRPGVSAAGGVTIPMRGNTEGQLIAAAERMNPSTLSTHNLVYPRAYVQSGRGEEDYPTGGNFSGRAVRQTLGQNGRVERMYNQPVMTDLPTGQQETSRNTIVAALLGGIISGVGSNIARRLVSHVGEEIEKTWEETASS